MCPDHLGAPGFETLLRVMRGDLGDDAAHLRHHARKIDLRLLRADTEASHVADRLRPGSDCEKGLGRNAARIEAFAPIAPASIKATRRPSCAKPPAAVSPAAPAPTTTTSCVQDITILPCVSPRD